MSLSVIILLLWELGLAWWYTVQAAFPEEGAHPAPSKDRGLGVLPPGVYRISDERIMPLEATRLH